MRRWCEIAPIPDKSAESVHAFLLKLVYRFGTCEILLHDQGREFNNSMVDDLCRLMNIHVSMTSAYHPQTNGLTGMYKTVSFSIYNTIAPR